MIANDEEKKSSSLPMKKRRLTYDPDPQAEGGVVKTEDLCVQLQGEVPPTHHPPSLSAVDDEAASADEVKKGQAEKKRKRKRSMDEPPVHPLIEKQRGGGDVLPASSSLQGEEMRDDTHENEEGEKEEESSDGNVSSCNKEEDAEGSSNDGTDISPLINDVLIDNISPSPSTFHHIGNRRYRVLVEANLANYFANVTKKELAAEGGENAQDALQKVQERKRQRVVESIIGCVKGNHPSGRFLVPTCPPTRGDNPAGGVKDKGELSSDKSTIAEEYGSNNWKVATEEQVTKKVNSTFVAAGRYHLRMARQEMARGLVQGLEGANGEEEEDAELANVDEEVQEGGDQESESSASPTSTEEQAKSPSASPTTPLPPSSKRPKLRPPIESESTAVADPNNEIEYLARESMRINAILARGKDTQRGRPNHPGGRPFNIIPHSRFAKWRRATTGELPTTIDQMYTSGSRQSSIAGSEDGTPPASLHDEKKGDVAEVEDDLTALAGCDKVSLKCPARVTVFLALPMDSFFVEEEAKASTADPVPPTVSPSSYLVPSNYDVLCGPSQKNFFHHIGNRRFRIMIEMNAPRYEEAYLASVTSKKDATNSVQELIDEMLQSLSKCDPPGRFLGMDMSTGRWRVLNPVYAQLKTELTFFECLQVSRRREARQVAVERLQHALEFEQEKRRGFEMEKEVLLKELGGRCSPPPPAASRQSPQCSLADGSCPARNSNLFLGLNEEDLSALQSQAQALLKGRRPTVDRNPMGDASRLTSLPQRRATIDELRTARVVNVPKSWNNQPEAAIRTSLDRLNEATAATAIPQDASTISSSRRSSSLPSSPSTSFTSAATSSSSGQQKGTMPKRGSNVSSSSESDHSDAVQHTSLHHAGAAASSGDQGMRDLLDVVGGMMMMARRGSC